MRRKIMAALVASVGLLVGPATRADVEGCRDAVARYNNAISEISFSLRRYRDCLAGSNGNEDCSSEFSHLRMDQDEFESAVSEHQSECELGVAPACRQEALGYRGSPSGSCSRP